MYIHVEELKKHFFSFCMLKPYVHMYVHQGCQMVYFKPKIEIWVNLGRTWNGKFWYIMYMTIWNALRPFRIIYGRLL
jgi:hypothetical protein